MNKIIKIERHEFIIYDLPYNHYSDCKYCGILRQSDYIKIGGFKIGDDCISDNEKIIKELLE